MNSGDQTENNTAWRHHGEVTPSPNGREKPEVVETTIPYVVVGFEVEDPEKALRGEAHDLKRDGFGHAFFYLVEKGKISHFFSFGPTNRNKDPWPRGGTAYYPIYDPQQHLFRIKLNEEQTISLKKQTQRVTGLIESGKMQWAVFGNVTCAATAKDILNSSSIETPSGYGPVALDGGMKFTVIDPWAWWAAFKKAGHQEVIHSRPLGKDQNAIRARLNEVDPVASDWE